MPWELEYISRHPPSPYLFEPIYLFLRFHDIPTFIQPVDQVVEVIYI